MTGASLDVEVRRVTLTVKGAGDAPGVSAGLPAEERAGLRFRTEQLLGEVELHPDGLPPSAVLVVRSLKTQAPRRLNPWQLQGQSQGSAPDARIWEGDVRAQLRTQAQEAPRPDRGLLPADAPALLFSDPGELVATLAVQVVEATPHPWLWQALGQTAVRRVAEVFLTSPREVPAALSRLMRWEKAVPVLQTLQETEARRVLACLCEAYRLADLSQVLRLPVGSGLEGLPGPWSAPLAGLRLPPGVLALLGIGLELAHHPQRVRSRHFGLDLRRWWQYESPVILNPSPNMRWSTGSEPESSVQRLPPRSASEATDPRRVEGETATGPAMPPAEGSQTLAPAAQQPSRELAATAKAPHTPAASLLASPAPAHEADPNGPQEAPRETPGRSARTLRDDPGASRLALSPSGHASVRQSSGSTESAAREGTEDAYTRQLRQPGVSGAGTSADRPAADGPPEHAPALPSDSGRDRVWSAVGRQAGTRPDADFPALADAPGAGAGRHTLTPDATDAPESAEALYARLLRQQKGLSTPGVHAASEPDGQTEPLPALSSRGDWAEGGDDAARQDAPARASGWTGTEDAPGAGVGNRADALRPSRDGRSTAPRENAHAGGETSSTDAATRRTALSPGGLASGAHAGQSLEALRRPTQGTEHFARWTPARFSAWLQTEGIQTRLGGIFFLIPMLPLALERPIGPLDGLEQFERDAEALLNTRLRDQTLLSRVSPSAYAWWLLKTLAWRLLEPLTETELADPIWPVLESLAGTRDDSSPSLEPDSEPDSELSLKLDLAALLEPLVSPVLPRLRHLLLARLTPGVHYLSTQSEREALPELRTDLLSVPARVYVSPCHVDVCIGLNDILMPVRLAGLDVDPGWQPLFGKVIQLYFR